MIVLPSVRVGLDIGTANTLVYVEGRGIAVNERSLVTIRRSTGAIEAVGGEAEIHLGRTPRKFQTARPIQGGGIIDLDLFGCMLHRFLGKARTGRRWRRLEVAAAVPARITTTQQLAVVESIQNEGAAEVLLVDPALAAAAGAGLPVRESRGRMVVDIGAGVTDLAILSHGKTVSAQSIQIAGDAMDAAIAANVEAVHDLVIGERTAERLKLDIGSAAASPERSVAIKGRCARSGVPRQAEVRGNEVHDALRPVLEQIAGFIRKALENAPSELGPDLLETGIVLTGGSALLRGIDRFVAEHCGVPVRVAADPLSCVIRGVAGQLERFRQHGRRGSAGVR